MRLSVLLAAALVGCVTYPQAGGFQPAPQASLYFSYGEYYPFYGPFFQGFAYPFYPYHPGFHHWAPYHWHHGVFSAPHPQARPQPVVPHPRRPYSGRR